MPRTVPARSSHPQHVHYIALNFTAPAPAAGLVIGTVPAGSMLRDVQFANDVAIAGGTPVASVGITGSAASILAAGTLTALANPPQAVIAALRPTADQEIRLFLTGGVTTGSGRVAVSYIPPL